MKRWTFRILFFLILYSGGGVVTTVGVAWGLALWPVGSLIPKQSETSSFVEDVGFIRVITVTRVGEDRIILQRLLVGGGRPWYVTMQRSAALRDLSDEATQRRTDVDLQDFVYPDGFVFVNDLEQILISRPHFPGTTMFDVMVDSRIGWPWRSLSARLRPHAERHRLANTFEWTLVSPSDAILLGGGLRGNLPPDSAFLPLRPILPGFMINTLFYAAMWFGIFFGVAALRRFVRKKRGRCVKCSYDLRGQFDRGCPECGWGRK